MNTSIGVLEVGHEHRFVGVGRGRPSSAVARGVIRVVRESAV
jgi:hypothetical protein